MPLHVLAPEHGLHGLDVGGRLLLGAPEVPPLAHVRCALRVEEPPEEAALRAERRALRVHRFVGARVLGVEPEHPRLEVLDRGVLAVLVVEGEHNAHVPLRGALDHRALPRGPPVLLGQGAARKVRAVDVARRPAPVFGRREPTHSQPTSSLTKSTKCFHQKFAPVFRASNIHGKYMSLLARISRHGRIHHTCVMSGLVRNPNSRGAPWQEDSQTHLAQIGPSLFRLRTKSQRNRWSIRAPAAWVFTEVVASTAAGGRSCPR